MNTRFSNLFFHDRTNGPSHRLSVIIAQKLFKKIDSDSFWLSEFALTAPAYVLCCL
jgi:hypothetical protein